MGRSPRDASLGEILADDGADRSSPERLFELGEEELLLQTGIRQSECAAITLGDMQLPARVSRDEGNVGSLRVHGKGRKDRVVTLNYKAVPRTEGLSHGPPEGRRGGAVSHQVREAARDALDPEHRRQVLA